MAGTGMYQHTAMPKCVEDPYYHLSKDRSYVTYPDAQDTADRLRAIRSVCEPLKKLKTTWPLVPLGPPKPPAAKPAVYSPGLHTPVVGASPGSVVYPTSAAWAAPATAVAPVQQQPALVVCAPRPRSNDDPARALQFWEGGRCSTSARVAAAGEEAASHVAAGMPDRVHSSMWHASSSGGDDAEGAAAAAAPAARAAAGGLPVFSASVCQAAALHRAEHNRRALSAPLGLAREQGYPASANSHLYHPHHHIAAQQVPVGAGAHWLAAIAGR